MPVPGTRSLNTSLVTVMLCPGLSGFTVRRARICVAGFTSSAYFRSTAKSPGPVTATETVPSPTPVAEMGRLTAAALLGLERQCLVRILDGERTVGGHRDLIIAGLAFDIVEVEPERALVAHQQEARERGGEHHGIAHHDVGRGVADLVVAPGDRHHPHGADEARNVEADLGGAVRTNRDDAGIERERCLGRRTALQLAFAAVATRPDLAPGALHAVDQLAVQVADLGGELALAEIISVGVGRLVVGEIEDTDIDR